METPKPERITIKHQMNESWHIPRASLSGSGSGSDKSHSNPSTVSRNFKMIANDSTSSSKNKHTNRHDRHNNQQQQQQQQQRRADRMEVAILHGTNRVDGRWRQQSNRNVNNHNNNNQHSQQQPKRGSHSSQGSSDSHNSNSQSISSGSLLLTAANLERFAEIHKKQNNNKGYPNSHYNINLMLASSLPSTHQTHQTKDAVISIDQQQQHFDIVKTKDVDTISMASSTHFTMVNGEGGPSRKNQSSGICSRGKQVTVLITTMSLLFLLVIIGMVYALELRAREMPQS